MRIPLATSIKTRTGAPSSKDARLVNSYVEVKGEQSVVRKRPIAQGGVAVGSGTAQGGIGFTLGGTNYIYTLNGDTGALDTLATAGTNWSVSTAYITGDYVVVDFEWYWAITPNIGVSPTSGSGSTYWSSTYVAPTYRAPGSHVTYTASYTISLVNNSTAYGVHLISTCTIKISGTDASVWDYAVIVGTVDQSPELLPTFTGRSCSTHVRYTEGANISSGASCGDYVNGAYVGGGTNTISYTAITSETEYTNAVALAAAMTY